MAKSKESSVQSSGVDGVTVATSVLSLYAFFLTIFLVNNFGYNATFFGNAKVQKTLTATDAVAENTLVLPVDKSGSVASPSTGSIEYDTASGSLLAYNGTAWEEVGGASIHAETVETLVKGVNPPWLSFALDASYNGTVRTVTDEATLNSALAAAVDNDVISLANDITLTATLTVPAKRLKFELAAGNIQGPTSLNPLINVNANTKDVLFTNGRIQYSSGTTSSTSILVSGVAGTRLYFVGTTLVYGEFAISITNGGNTALYPSLFMDTCIITYDGAVGGAGNSNRCISVNGLSDTSYVYLNSCFINAVNADDTHRMRVIQTSGLTDKGDITFTGCSINPACRLQAVVFYEASTSQVRGSHKLMMDRNTIGTSGQRNQLALLFAGGSTMQNLNSFEAIWFVENTVNRQDDDKGLFYIDTSVAGAGYNEMAGSTDVYVVKNTIPTLTAPGASRRLISKDGFVRGSNVITSAYLQRYRL